MVFIKRSLVATLVLSVLLLGNTAFADSQNPTDSLNRLKIEAATQKVTLDEATRVKIQNSCQSTQNVLKSIRQKEQKIQRERKDTYLDVQNEIDALQLRIKRQGIEVGGVAAALVSYRELTDQYDRLSKLYMDNLNDSIAIDCRVNPEPFIAGLALIRQKRAQLLENTNQVKTYIFTDVQTQFEIIKKGLKV